MNAQNRGEDPQEDQEQPIDREAGLNGLGDRSSRTGTDPDRNAAGTGYRADELSRPASGNPNESLDEEAEPFDDDEAEDFLDDQDK